MQNLLFLLFLVVLFSLVSSSSNPLDAEKQQERTRAQIWLAKSSSFSIPGLSPYLNKVSNYVPSALKNFGFMLMYAVVFLLVGIVCLVLGLILVGLQACSVFSDHRALYRKRENVCGKCLLGLICIILILISIYGIVSSVRLDSSVSKVIGNVEQLLEYYGSTTTQCIDNVTIAAALANYKIIIPVDITNVLHWMNVTDVTLKGSTVDKARHIFSWSVKAGNAAILILAFLAFCAAFWGLRNFLKFLIFIGLLLMFLCWMITTVGSSASLLLAELCVNLGFDNTTLQFINSTQVSDCVEVGLKHFLFCDNFTQSCPNPFEELRSDLSVAITYLSFKNTYNRSVHMLENAKVLLGQIESCNISYTQYYAFQDEICNPASTSIMSITFSYFLSGIIFLLFIYLSLFSLHRIVNRSKDSELSGVYFPGSKDSKKDYVPLEQSSKVNAVVMRPHRERSSSVFPLVFAFGFSLIIVFACVVVMLVYMTLGQELVKI